MVKGNQRENTGTSFNKKYVGFTKVEVVAINPTRAELNKLYGKEDSDEDKELTYLGEDKEGNPRIKLAFYLHDAKLDKYFVHSLNLIKKTRISQDGLKMQYVNSTCNTAWAPIILDDAGEPTDKADESLLVEFFTNFQNKERENIGTKEIRAALVGEEELVTFVRAWLGRMNWNSPDASVLLDTEALFKEDYSELRGLIDGEFDAPFVILLGVETDEDDTEKQYQKVWNKGFLPGSFMKDIDKGFKFGSDYGRKIFNKFEETVDGQYGFKAFYEIAPIKEYDKAADVASAPKAKADVTTTNKKF